MDILLLALLLSIGIFVLNGRQQRQRIGLLASHLAQYQIEKLLENLIGGYMRALGETDPARRQQIWDLLRTTELQLSEQFGQLAAEMARLDAALTRVSTLPLALPFADQWWPRASFDLRQAFKIHAEGIERAVRNDAQRAPKDKAFMLMAELFLMQHTCHWYCKSKPVASARLLARHQTAYAQVIDAVDPATRRAYLALVKG